MALVKYSSVWEAAFVDARPRAPVMVPTTAIRIRRFKACIFATPWSELGGGGPLSHLRRLGLIGRGNVGERRGPAHQIDEEDLARVGAVPAFGLDRLRLDPHLERRNEPGPPVRDARLNRP